MENVSLYFLSANKMLNGMNKSQTHDFIAFYKMSHLFLGVVIPM